MPVTYGPQQPGWEPFREQERQRELAKLDAAVTAADDVTTADGDLTEDIWQDLQAAAAGLPPAPLQHGPQFAGWDPFREQETVRKHHTIERTVEAAQVVATADGDATAEVWQRFELSLQDLDLHAQLFAFF